MVLVPPGGVAKDDRADGGPGQPHRDPEKGYHHEPDHHRERPAPDWRVGIGKRIEIMHQRFAAGYDGQTAGFGAGAGHYFLNGL